MVFTMRGAVDSPHGPGPSSVDVGNIGPELSSTDVAYNFLDLLLAFVVATRTTPSTPSSRRLAPIFLAGPTATAKAWVSME